MNIAVIQTRSGIGDMCLFLQSIHAISEHYNSKIILFASKTSKAKEFLFNDKSIKEIIYIDENQILFKNFFIISNFFKKKISKIFIMHFSFRYFFLSKISFIKEIYKYGFKKKDVNISSYMQLMTHKWLKLKKINFNSRIYFPHPKNNENNIIIGIGGSGETKKWPIENYIQLIKLISEKNYFKYIIAGGFHEKNDYELIKSKLKNYELVSLCEKSIKESMNFIYGSRLYIGNDTGFMHLSAASNIRALGLFGDTPINYAEYNKLITPITPKNFTYVGHNSRAMNKILVNQVYDYIKTIL